MHALRWAAIFAVLGGGRVAVAAPSGVGTATTATLTPTAPVGGTAPTAPTSTVGWTATATPTLEGGAVYSITVRGQRGPVTRAASQFRVEREILEAAPHADTSALLSTVPGFYVSRSEGEAVAPRISLRGFDAEHGQDLEMIVSGIPLNQRSHLHGQGYADLSFIPPEVVEELRVTEGVYDPRQGDFATAGTIELLLGVIDRGLTLKSEYGSFGTQRHLLLWAPEGQSKETFGVFSYRQSDGYGGNRGSQAATGLAQYTFSLNGLEARLHAAVGGARANFPGVLRKEDVDAGRVDLYGNYPVSTAEAQSALNLRTELGLSLHGEDEEGRSLDLDLYAALTSFRLRANYSGYLERSRFNPDWVGRGDLIEQSNLDFMVGARAHHQTAKYTLGDEIWLRVDVGLDTRVDRIGQAQNLLEAPQNQTWDQRVEADVTAGSVGGYLGLELSLGHALRLRAGYRADALFFDVDDALGNFIPRFRRESYLVGFRRTALGLAAGPRANLQYHPFEWLTLLAAYGEGYRSPQARQLEEGETAPFAKVRSGDLGFRIYLADQDGEASATLTGSAYWTTLATDVVFDASEGSLTRVGPTTRQGFVLHADLQLFDWIYGAASLTYVHATLDAPPPATAENPTPAFVPGNLLPYVPPIVARLDAGLHHSLFEVQAAPLLGRLGLGLSYLSARPLPYQQFADPFVTVDARASLGWRALELGVDALNLLGTRYAAEELVFVSNWSPDGFASRLPARHLIAGPPRTILGFLEVHL